MDRSRLQGLGVEVQAGYRDAGFGAAGAAAGLAGEEGLTDTVAEGFVALAAASAVLGFQNSGSPLSH
jgi:hypothetical protein